MQSTNHLQFPLCGLLYLVLALMVQTAIGLDIIQGPLSLNTSLHSPAVFTCQSTSDSVFIGWAINGQNVVAFGGVVTPLPLDPVNRTLSSSLTLNATLSLNNSNITCFAFSPHHPLINSSALLMIQGLLSPVSDVTLSPINSSTIVINWSPLYSLSNVPIHYYHLELVGIYSTTSTTTTVANTTTTAVVSVPHQCDDYNVTIYGRNQVGNGWPYTTHLSLIQAPSIDLINVTISRPDPDGPPIANISLQVYQDGCNGVMSHVVMVTDGSHTHLYGPLMSDDDGVVPLSLTHLHDDSVYDYQIWISNVGGASNAINTTISTFGVQSATTTPISPGALCVTCHFMMGSTDIGCYVTIRSSSVAIYIQRPSTSDTSSEGCASRLEGGNYTIDIYDIDSNGVIDSTIAVTVRNVMVPFPTTVVVTTTTTYTTSSSSSTAVYSISLPSLTPNATDTIAADIYRNTAIGVGVVFIVLMSVLVVVIACHCRRRRISKMREISNEDRGTLRRTNSFQSRPTHEYETNKSIDMIAHRNTLSDTVPSVTLANNIDIPPPPPLHHQISHDYIPRSTLRSTPVMSAWAAVNKLAIPVPLDPHHHGPYGSHGDTNTSGSIPHDVIDRPQSAVILSSSSGSDNGNTSGGGCDVHHASSDYKTDYVQLDFNDSSPSTRPCHHNPFIVRHSLPSCPIDHHYGVQYSIISSYGLHISSHNNTDIIKPVYDSLV